MSTARLEWLMQRCANWQEIDARSLAREMLDEGQFDEDFVARAAENHATTEVRKLLKRRDPQGVPLFANVKLSGISGETRQRYRAVSLFGPDDYRSVVAYHLRTASRELATADKYAGRAKDQYQVQLQIPQLVYASKAA